MHNVYIQKQTDGIEHQVYSERNRAGNGFH